MALKDRARLLKLFSAALGAFSVLMGALLAGQTGIGAAQLGGVEQLPRIVVPALVRSVAPATSGSAMLLALLLWSHPLPPPLVRQELRPVLLRAFGASMLGYPFALVIGLSSSAITAALFFGVPSDGFQVALAALGRGDFGAGALTTVFDAALVCLLSFKGLPYLLATRWSLPGKIGVAWAVAFVVRSIVGLAVSLASPPG